MLPDSRVPGSLTFVVPARLLRRPDGSLSIELLASLVGVAPGQNVVLYDGTWCLGGGTIEITRTLWDDQQLPGAVQFRADEVSAARGFPEFAPAAVVESTVLSDGKAGFPIPVRTKMYAVPSIRTSPLSGHFKSGSELR